MIKLSNFYNINTDEIFIDDFWNVGTEKEMRMHRIHSYPAKFPAFLTTKALRYVEKEGLHPQKIADIFCGCGTTAYETRRNNKNFWGCDINPVATLIARVKSSTFQEARLNRYYKKIIDCFYKLEYYPTYDEAKSRLQYWYLPEQYNDLSKLKQAILTILPNETKYQLFFLCAFSNILKSASKWLTKSIKPQVDPYKPIQNVLSLFQHQVDFMILANFENRTEYNGDITIETKNFLDSSVFAKDIDMIITSPPYVTSYEYADLHQLSTLWLDYADDYRDLRKGSIGSDYCKCNISDFFSLLNSSGRRVVEALQEVDKLKARSVAQYYSDMQKVAIKSYRLLNKDGYAMFIIGNTEYKNIKIDNALHLIESMFNTGFSEIQITKRKISNKILTPYRDEKGKFSSNSNGRKVYNEEFIIIGKK